MRPGSFTSVGVAYPRDIGVEGLARAVVSLLGTVLEPVGDCWPVRFFSAGAWIHLELRPQRDRELAVRHLKRWLTSRYGELEAMIPLGDGIRVVIRPRTAHTGILMDIADADLDGVDAQAAVEALLGRWHAQSPFAVAFVDEEAEYERDPLDVSPESSPWALLGTPGDEGILWHAQRWPLSELGARE